MVADASAAGHPTAMKKAAQNYDPIAPIERSRRRRQHTFLSAAAAAFAILMANHVRLSSTKKEAEASPPAVAEQQLRGAVASPPYLSWTEVAESGLPSTPVLLRGSPMQRWLAANRGTWDVASIAELAARTSAGEYNVTLQWQDDDARFMPHKGLESNGRTSPQYQSAVTTLREALAALWPPDDDDVPTHSSSSSPRYHYLSADLEDLPPSISSPVLEFLPTGCVVDERFEGGGAGFWNLASPDSDCRVTDADCHVASPDAYCRGLRSNLWLGEAGVSAALHFDNSHNLVRGVCARRPRPPAYSCHGHTCNSHQAPCACLYWLYHASQHAVPLPCHPDRSRVRVRVVFVFVLAVLPSVRREALSATAALRPPHVSPPPIVAWEPSCRSSRGGEGGGEGDGRVCRARWRAGDVARW